MHLPTHPSPKPRVFVHFHPFRPYILPYSLMLAYTFLFIWLLQVSLAIFQTSLIMFYTLVNVIITYPHPSLLLQVAASSPEGYTV